jgi:CO/xanthine dehydrogenase FAD-binding subunit
VRDFKYFRPKTLKEALKILRNERGKVLAGGTDLLVKMKDGLIYPESVIDITLLEELRNIRQRDGRVEIGALATLSMVASSQIIQLRAPHLAESARLIGSPQIRNMATIGGNIVNASPAGDSIPPLYTLNSELILESENEKRVVKIEDFFSGPGVSSIRPHELLTAITFPFPEEPFFSFFKKVGQRKALAISKISLAFLGVIEEQGRSFRDVRISLGAVAPTVIRARRTEDFLKGKIIDQKVLEEVSGLCAEETKPISDIRSTSVYRRKVSGELLKKGLVEFTEGVIS